MSQTSYGLAKHGLGDRNVGDHQRAGAFAVPCLQGIDDTQVLFERFRRLSHQTGGKDEYRGSSLPDRFRRSMFNRYAWGVRLSRGRWKSAGGCGVGRIRSLLCSLRV